jgi:hypothetical protein
MKTIVVFDGCEYEKDWPPNDLQGHIAWLQAKLETVPERFRGRVSFSRKIEYEFGEPYSAIRIWYFET